MGFAARYKYDAEITRWLARFTAKALPTINFNGEILYEITPLGSAPEISSGLLFLTLDMPDGQVDISATVTKRAKLDTTSPSLDFHNLEITRDVQDERGTHLETLIWNDAEECWHVLEPPNMRFSVLQGGLEDRA